MAAPRSNRGFLVRVNARPHTIYVSQGRTVLSTGLDGFIRPDSDHGLFVHETRLVSRYRYLIDGHEPQPNVLSNVEQHSWLGYYLCLVPGVDAVEADRGSGRIPPVSVNPLELRVSRYAGEGVHEDLDITNFSQHRTAFKFAVELDADFADLAEAGAERIQQGDITRDWAAGTLSFGYKARHSFRNQNEAGVRDVDRRLGVTVRNAASAAHWNGQCLEFEVQLDPHAQWHACLDFIAHIDGETLNLRYGCRSFFAIDSDFDRKRQLYLDEAARFESPRSNTLTHKVITTLEQAKRDLAALRLYDLDRDDRSWTASAGLPLYVALYGRDALTSSWQAGMISPDLMRGTIPTLADLQGTQRNAWRDESPGRMIHEAHTGPLEVLNYNPRERSYGSVTTSSLYAFIVSELWHWTGDEALVRSLLDSALRALEWLDREGDQDGDGLYDYQTRSADGVRHQGWKDSPDAIVDEDGRAIDSPLATCEEQGFAYVSKLHFSETLWWLGDKSAAKRLFHEASELRKRFNDRFWMPDENCFALALDRNGRQIRSIASNAGHCIATGIADSTLVEKVTDRLFREDMFTGWGIRTLSSLHPAFNPYSYHLGSVWPVEHGTFALGFMRWGLHERTQQIAKAQFEAASLFDFYRLPELFGGHARDEDHPFPAIYPNANTPQAWSASTVFSLLQALLGLYPYAPLNLLVVDPHLPDWLPDITLRNLRVGKATATIRFRRKKNGESTYTVLRKRGKLHVVRQPTPWSLTATWPERLRDWLTSLLPGK